MGRAGEWCHRSASRYPSPGIAAPSKPGPRPATRWSMRSRGDRTATRRRGGTGPGEAEGEEAEGQGKEVVTTEEDFHALLEAHPDDHSTRLILADFLDDRGDPRGPGYRALA